VIITIIQTIATEVSWFQQSYVCVVIWLVNWIRIIFLTCRKCMAIAWEYRWGGFPFLSSTVYFNWHYHWFVNQSVSWEERVCWAKSSVKFLHTIRGVNPPPPIRGCQRHPTPWLIVIFVFFKVFQCKLAFGACLQTPSNICQYSPNFKFRKIILEVMEGRMEGKRPRGRNWMGMLEEIYKKESYGNMKRRAEDPILWKCWMPWTCQQTEH